MPSNYNGSSTGITPRQQVTIACPVGTDAPNAASVNNPLQALANQLQYLMEKAALLGVSSDSNPAYLSLGSAILAEKLLTKAPDAVAGYREAGTFLGGAGSSIGRLFVKGGGAGDPLQLALGVNAKRNAGDTAWERDDASVAAVLLTLVADGTMLLDVWPAAGAGFTIGALVSVDAGGNLQIEGVPGLRLASVVDAAAAGDAVSKSFLCDFVPSENLNYPSSLLNAWESFSVPPSGDQAFGYYRHAGRVHFVGAIKAGGGVGAIADSAVLVMPSGFRAAKKASAFVPGGAVSGDTARVAFMPADSTIYVVAATGNAVIDLSGFSYLADGT